MEILKDITESGKERPWRLYKRKNEYLAKIYDDIDSKKAERLRNCASVLEFRQMPDFSRKLERAHFCRVRLCPVCAWRRSLKAFAQVTEIVKYLKFKKPYYAYLFVTLTIRNCQGDELTATLDKMFSAFHELNRWPKWKKAIKGYVRAFEVTRNVTDNTYHPHVHFVVAVDGRNYFTRERDLYISHEELRSKWKKILKLDYDPEVRIQRMRDFSPSAVAEVTKYSVKFNDYLDFNDWQLSHDAVENLDKALHKRRFLAFGGCFSEARKALLLDDIETGDFIDFCEPNVKRPDLPLIRFFWNGGYNEYISS